MIDDGVNTEEVQEFIKLLGKCSGSLVAFRSAFLTKSTDETSPAEFHYTWSKELLSGERNIAFEAFRSSAKSQYVLRSFLLYVLTYMPETLGYVVLIKANATQAQNKLKEVSREFDALPFVRNGIYKPKVVENSASCFMISIEDENGKLKQVRIETYGKGASIRGLSYGALRPQLVLIDDIQDTDDMRSETVLASDWDWFLSDICFLGQEGSRVFMIGNNLGEKCVIERVFDNAEDLGFETVKIGIEDSEGEPTWPSKYSKQFIEEERARYVRMEKIDVWLRERMCISVAPETQIFNKDDLQYYAPGERKELLKNCNIYILCDIATSQSASADYTAYVVLAVDSDDIWYVIDIWYGRWDGATRIDKLFELVVAYKPFRVGIEKAGMKDALRETIDSEMAKRRIRFTKVDLIPPRKMNKEEKIEYALAQRVKLNQLWLPEKASWLDEFLTELEMMTINGSKSLHDDLIDALSYGYQIAKPPMTTERTQELNEKYRNINRNSMLRTVVR